MVFTTVIFDFGGVITSSPFKAFNRMEAESGLPLDFVRSVNSANPDSNAWAKFERAEIDAAAFDRLFADEAETLGHRLEGSAVIACLSGDIRPDMVAALDQLKAEGFKLGCVTNNVPSGHGAGMSGSVAKANAVSAIMARFDHVIESSKVGVRKPDPRIYQMMCETLGGQPTECVYLDDLGINCKPAAALGMAALKVTSGEQALAELGTLLAFSFAPVGG